MRTSADHPSRPIRRVLVPFVAAALALGAGVGMTACGGDDGPDGSDDIIVDDVLPFDESLIIGLPLDEATEAAEAEGFILRTAIEDGEMLALTMDFVTNRVNVEVTDGVVTGVVSQG